MAIGGQPGSICLIIVFRLPINTGSTKARQNLSFVTRMEITDLFIVTPQKRRSASYMMDSFTCPIIPGKAPVLQFLFSVYVVKTVLGSANLQISNCWLTGPGKPDSD